MPKDEWGVKRACPHCTVRFYDLGNDPMTCPNCAEVFDVASLTQSRQKAAEKAKPKVVKPTPPAASQADTDGVLDDDDSQSSTGSEATSDDLLDDDDDTTVSLDEIASVAKETDE